MQNDRSKTWSRSRSRKFAVICIQMSMRHPWLSITQSTLAESRLRIQPTEQNLVLGYFVGIRLHENSLQIF